MYKPVTQKANAHGMQSMLKTPDINVPDRRSRDLEVIVVGRAINLGTGNLEWGGNGEGVEEGEVSLRVT
jgi:hypothetical protein